MEKFLDKAAKKGRNRTLNVLTNLVKELKGELQTESDRTPENRWLSRDSGIRVATEDLRESVPSSHAGSHVPGTALSKHQGQSSTEQPAGTVGTRCGAALRLRLPCGWGKAKCSCPDTKRKLLKGRECTEGLRGAGELT